LYHALQQQSPRSQPTTLQKLALLFRLAHHSPHQDCTLWTTVDVNIGYRVDGGSDWLANTQFNLGINNALDQRPPFVNQFDLPSGTLGYDLANASLLDRQFSLLFVKRWGQCARFASVRRWFAAPPGHDRPRS
jgi:outer membrane receptor protein involved in Fe transport